MLAELRSEYIFFEPETLEVNFPNGTLQSKEEEGKDYDTFAFDWSEKAIKEIVHAEYIFFEPETLEVNFPNGTLQSKEEEGKDYDTFAFDWSEKAIKEIVHDWAIPKEIHQE